MVVVVELYVALLAFAAPAEASGGFISFRCASCREGSCPASILFWSFGFAGGERGAEPTGIGI